MGGHLLDLCVEQISKEPHKYHDIRLLPTVLADRILEKCTETAQAGPLLRLVTGEQWRISKLTVSKQQIDKAFLKILGSVKNTLAGIEMIECKFDKTPTRSSVEYFSEFTHLSSISFVNCTNLTEKHLKLIPVDFWMHIKRLRIVDVRSPLRLEGIPLPMLSSLALVNCDIGSKNLIDLLRRLENRLKVLDLSKTLKSIRFFTENASIVPHVEELCLFGVEVDVTSLLSIPAWFPSLKRLIINIPSKFQLFDSLDIFEMATDQLEFHGISIITTM